MLEALGGRKFILSLLVTVAGALIHIYSAKGLTNEMVVLLLGISGSFHLSNAMVSRMTGIPANKAEKDEPEEPEASDDVAAVTPAAGNPDLTAMKEQLTQLSQAHAAILTSVANTNKLLVAALNK